MTNQKNKMPVLFLGHGSPMNAIEDNEFTRALGRLAEKFPQPKAILSVSAHWTTEGNFLTSGTKPRVIYDMMGFPEELYEVNYPAPGSPELVEQMIKDLPELNLQKDQGSWGLDHGTWTMLVHLYPKADIPVVQLSLNENESLDFFYKLGQKISYLREQGVLIFGSGNIVHNLRRVDWGANPPVMTWAAEFEKAVLEKIQSGQIQDLYSKFNELPNAKLAHPHIDHYQPLIVALGASQDPTAFEYAYKGFQMGSLSMTSLILQK